MIKSLSPEIAKTVGNSASMLLNQMVYLFKSWGREKIYRTSKQFYSDMEGLISESTIKRCKKKLIDAGLIIVTFDRGLKRQSFYQLTNKAKGMLSHIIPEWSIFKDKSNVDTNTSKDGNFGVASLTEAFDDKDGVVSEVKKSSTVDKGDIVEVFTKEELKHMDEKEVKNKNNIWQKNWKKPDSSPYMPNGNTTQMKNSFKEGFTNKNSTAMPEKLSKLFRKNKPKPKPKDELFSLENDLHEMKQMNNFSSRGYI